MAYPLPRIDESMMALVGSKVFSCFDFKSAYHRVEIAYQHRTEFSSIWGLYEIKRMPFGLVNARATFQRIIWIIQRTVI